MPQSALPEGEAYEAFIHRTGQVPTRENLHDLFNALVWLRFPQAKRRLNELQAGQIARDGVQATRGAVRDALTVFDENGALLVAPDPLWLALEQRDWQRLFVAERQLWQQARLVLFGHALLEKLMQPRKGMVAHVVRVEMPIQGSEYPQNAAEIARLLDASLARSLTAEKFATKPFLTLPVLGIPGWWAANEMPAFYDDPAVFRLPRAR